MVSQGSFFAGDEEGIIRFGREAWMSPRRGALLMPFLAQWRQPVKGAFMAPLLARGISLKSIGRGSHHALDLYVASRKEASWLVALCPLGGPAAAIAAEILIAGGVRKLLFFGFCGALTTSLVPGNLILAPEAIREDGTSYHYLREGQRAKGTPGLIDEVAEALAASQIDVSQGIVWTTDAPFRETETKVRRHVEAGAVCVEMEVASVYSVCSFRGVESAALLGVTDSLAGESWTGFKPLAGLKAWAAACRSGAFDRLAV